MLVDTGVPAVIRGSQTPLGDAVPAFQRRFSVTFDQDVSIVLTTDMSLSLTAKIRVLCRYSDLLSRNLSAL